MAGEDPRYLQKIKVDETMGKTLPSKLFFISMFRCVVKSGLAPSGVKFSWQQYILHPLLVGKIGQMHRPCYRQQKMDLMKNGRVPFCPFHHASQVSRQGSVQKISPWNHGQQIRKPVRLILLHFLQKTIGKCRETTFFTKIVQSNFPNCIILPFNRLQIINMMWQKHS